MSREPAKRHWYDGLDPKGFPRVYGVGPTNDVAETECSEAIIEYLLRRPDMGPVDRWQMRKRIV